MRTHIIFVKLNAIIALFILLLTAVFTHAAPFQIDGTKTTITFDSGGTTVYDAAQDQISIDATPIALGPPPPQTISPLNGQKYLRIRAVVDQTGALVGGVAGDDLALWGQVLVGASLKSGMLLRGEVTEFSYVENGPNDEFYFKVQVTGGLLASLYTADAPDGIIGVQVTSEGSSFTGSFESDFNGGAKGSIGIIIPQLEPGKLGDRVWNDLDGNGVQDPGEPGVEGVTVTLFECDGTEVGSMQTDSSGNYLFTGLLGSYYVVFSDLPAGFVFTQQNNAGALPNNDDSDADPVTGKTVCTAIEAGEEDRNWDAGIRQGVCGVAVSATCTVLAPPEVSHQDDCQDHKVVRLGMRYTGEDCSSTSHNQDAKKVKCEDFGVLPDVVYILATDKKDPDDSKAKKWFEGQVQRDATYVIDAMAGGSGSLKKDTYIHVFADSGHNTLLQTVKFHTSCSQPLAVGNQFGASQVVEMTTDDGRTIKLPEPTPPTPQPNCVLPGLTGDNCQGKVETLQLLYTAQSCSASHHTQTADKVDCADLALLPDVVYVVANDHDNPADGKIWFTGLVNNGDPFTISAAAGGASELSSTTWLHVFDQPGGTLLQTIKFHTSCSQPLNLGDQFGSMVVFGMDTTEGTLQTLGTEVEFTYVIENTGEININALAVTDLLGPVDVSGITLPLQPGETATLSVTVQAIPPLLNHVTVVANNDPNCTADTETIIEEAQPPKSCCEYGKLVGLTLQYTADDCSATSHFQAADKVACEDFASPLPATVYLIVNEDADPTRGKTWFAGQVSQGGLFLVDPTTAGASGLSSTTWIHVFDAPGGALLQRVKFHTSCSQPLGAGDQFGSVRVVDCFGENEPPLAALGDRVWHDLNGNGQQDADEPGVGGVLVKLFQCDGTFAGVKTTDANGNYLFTGLAPGDYYTEFSGLPSGFVFSPQGPAGASDPTDSDVNPATGRTECTTLAAGETDLTWDAGIWIYNPAEMGDRVWFDENGNGIQDSGESGIQDVTVQLFRCDGTLVADTQTDVDGNYLFSGLWPGDYYVAFSDVPGGLTFTVQGPAMGSDAEDSDAHQVTGVTACTTLSPGESDLTWDAGLTWQDCALEVGAHCTVKLPPQSPSADDCHGKVIRLSLLYTADDCTAMSHQQSADKVSCSGIDAPLPATVHIIANDNVDPTSGKVWFDGEVTAGSTYVIDAATAGENDLPANTFIHIFNVISMELVQTVQFHTSCSQPLAVGNQFGANQVVAMTTTEGGTVSLPDPTPPAPQSSCVIPAPATDNCNGHVEALQLAYTAEDCSASLNTQAADKVECADSGPLPASVFIVANDNDDPATGKVWFSGPVSQGEIFTLSAAAAGDADLSPETRIHVFDHEGGARLQFINLHTSCSQPLNLGDQFGSVLVVGLDSTEGPLQTLGTEVEFTYTIKRTDAGANPLTGLTVSDAFGPLEIAPETLTQLAAGETVVLTMNQLLVGPVVNTLTVIGQTAAGYCVATASTTVEAEPPQVSCCDSGKPTGLTLEYTAQDCSATTHSQDASKVTCQDAASLADSVFIVANDNDDPNAGHIWFSGPVTKGDLVMLDTAGAGFSAETRVHIFDAQNGALLQFVKFHTSCSQPLLSGDQFGSLRLVGCF